MKIQSHFIIVDAEVVSFDRGETFEVALIVRDADTGAETRRMCTPTWRQPGPAAIYASAVKAGKRKAEVLHA